jgi:hypothetical protein
VKDSTITIKGKGGKKLFDEHAQEVVIWDEDYFRSVYENWYEDLEQEPETVEEVNDLWISVMDKQEKDEELSRQYLDWSVVILDYLDETARMPKIQVIMS